MRQPEGPTRLKDVALRAGVSQGLVSRLLNNDPTLNIREDTRRNILDAVKELDYVPNSTATALRKSRTNSIGLVLDHVTNPVFAEIVRGAQQAAAKVDCVLLLIEADEVVAAGPLFKAMIKARRVDGLLIQGGYGPGEKHVSELAGLIPSVIVNSTGTESAAGVRLQDELAASIATKHLLDLGHRDLAFITGTSGTAAEARGRGYSRAFASAGLEADPSSIIHSGWDAQQGFEAVTQLLNSGSRPTGYVVASSSTAVGVLAALAEHGLRVPEDASVVGIHDSWFVPYLQPPLTTVALPLYELGRRSVELLMSRLRGERQEDLEISDPGPELMLRSSTSAPPAAAR